MLLDGKLSLELVLESGQVLPEVANGGVTYVVAPPGERFIVRVTNGRSKAIYRVWLSVDGVDAGITKYVRPGKSRGFKGILVNSVGERAQLKLFQFKDATASEPAAPQAAQPTALSSIKLGQLVLTAVQVVDSGRRKVRQDVHRNPHDAPSGVKLPDGKKWFLAPSLSAANRPTVAEEIKWSTVQWREVSGRSKHTLRYETASTLVLRGILQEDQPGHRALIQASLRQEANRVAAADVKPEPADVKPEPAGTSAHGNLAAPSSSRAQERKRRLEQGAASSGQAAGSSGQRASMVGSSGQGAGSSSGQRAPMVDLSIEQDDDVLCDLTGEAPAWHWGKKPRIEIQ